MKARVMRLVCAATLLSFILLFAGWGVAHAGTLSTEAVNAVAAVAQQQGYVITGTVVDNYGEELIGVAVQLRSNMSIGVSTNIDGNFFITVPTMNDVLVFSFIGMATQELRLVAGTTHYRVVMVEDAAVLDVVEIVEMGIATRERATMSGAAVSFSQEELISVGTINVLQAIRTLDPAFIMIENLQAGSDPNRMPTFELRGQTNLDIVGPGGVAQDVNMPLFLIDGFEVTMREVNDLDISRIQSVTLLKDAGSTAIFGARGANGVVVIETIRPAPGRVQVRYTGNFELSFADLSQYNLMNAREKMRFEVLSRYFGNLDNPENVFGLMRYQAVLRRVESGIDTDWLRMPIQLALTQNHSLNVSGGDRVWLFTTGINYRNVQGVMKGSNRETFGGNLRVHYRGVEGLNISNNIQVSGLNARTGGWGSFRDFAQANPHQTPFDAYGVLLRFLDAGAFEIDDDGVFTIQGSVANPLHNASLYTFGDTYTLSIRNQLRIDWRVTERLRFDAGVSLSNTLTNNVNFVDARNTRFINDDHRRRGSYSENNSSIFTYLVDLRTSYVHVINDLHTISFSGRAAIEESITEGTGFSVFGFPEGAPPLPSFAYSFLAQSRPSFFHFQDRSVSASGTASYDFSRRYFADLTLNREGSNFFGSQHLFQTVWSIGGGWNVHREVFAQDWDWLSELRVRINYGTAANQGRRYLTANIYGFRPGSNLFGMSSYLSGIGNPHLNWLVVNRLSSGVDFGFRNPRVRGSFNVFRHVSDPLVIDLPQQASTGVGSTFPVNAGMMETVGYDFRLFYSPIHNTRERQVLTLRVTGGNNRSMYRGFGDAFAQMNHDLFNSDNATLENMLQRWEDGRSPQDMWAVRSLGIDPATGREIFLTRYGEQTFYWRQSDRVVVGNSRPTFEGTFGADFQHRQFRANISFRYILGAYIFNYALFTRVENISTRQLGFNQDRRALYDRWQRPGDISQFRSISLHDSTQISSRFLQKRNRLTGESINLVWDFNEAGWIQHLGMQSMNAGISMRDIFYLSTVRAERGIDFPFARAITFNINANF